MAINRQMYIYGNAVRQPEIVPERREEQLPSQPKRVSKQVRQNRKKAMHMSAGYVVYLTTAAVVALVICISYLQLRTETTQRSKNITTLQRELASAKDANTTAYDVAVDSVNLGDVKEKAINQMGMVAAAEGQVVKYQSPTNDYVKQYADIPQSGVLASSGKTSN